MSSVLENLISQTSIFQKENVVLKTYGFLEEGLACSLLRNFLDITVW